MSMTASKARLTSITKDLFLKWEDTKEYWKDSKCLEFEQKYMVDLLAGVDKAVGVIEQLDKLVKTIRSDCE